jgi:hypothetical protein
VQGVRDNHRCAGQGEDGGLAAIAGRETTMRTLTDGEREVLAELRADAETGIEDAPADEIEVWAEIEAMLAADLDALGDNRRRRDESALESMGAFDGAPF